jgi:predicted 3-demethylubiquinone-9 3-methyltransferase (glyoxalase superfamily)
VRQKCGWSHTHGNANFIGPCRNPEHDIMATFQKIVPCLWFDSEALQAAEYYVSIFEHSRIKQLSYYGTEGQEVHGRKPGSVMTVEFELDGIGLTALNAGPKFKFNEAISLQVMCETQEEIDRLWGQLTAGGDEAAQQCGWLKDKYGLSWQIVPIELAKLLTDSDPASASRTMKAMLKMKKLDLGVLKRAHRGDL